MRRLFPSLLLKDGNARNIYKETEAQGKCYWSFLGSPVCRIGRRASQLSARMDSARQTPTMDKHV